MQRGLSEVTGKVAESSRDGFLTVALIYYSMVRYFHPNFTSSW